MTVNTSFQICADLTPMRDFFITVGVLYTTKVGKKAGFPSKISDFLTDLLRSSSPTHLTWWGLRGCSCCPSCGRGSRTCRRSTESGQVRGSSNDVGLFKFISIERLRESREATIRSDAGSTHPIPIQSCVETFLLSSENLPQNVQLPTQKMH